MAEQWWERRGAAARIAAWVHSAGTIGADLAEGYGLLSGSREGLDVSETVDQLRQLLEELLQRMATAEDRVDDAPQAVRADSALDAQIEALGRKVDAASEMLAEFTDILESQTERIETIEEQLGDPDLATLRAQGVALASDPVVPVTEEEVPAIPQVPDLDANRTDAPQELGVLAALERLAAMLEAGGTVSVAADRPDDEDGEDGEPDDGAAVVGAAAAPERTAAAPSVEVEGRPSDAGAGSSVDRGELRALTERLDTLESIVLDFLEIYAAEPASVREGSVAAAASADAAPDSGETRRVWPDLGEQAADRLVESASAAAAESAAFELRDFLEPRLRGVELRVDQIEARITELRQVVTGRDRQVRELEDRLLILVDADSDGLDDDSDGLGRDAVAVVGAENQVFAASGRQAPQPLLRRERFDEPSLGAEPDDEGLGVAGGSDARSAHTRLAELVEREVSVKREFRPGGVVASSLAEVGSGPRPTVMVVDDSADARTILSIFLSKTGFHVVTAVSAEDCLAKLRHHHVDAVVLDASMPGASGAYVCRTLRHDATYGERRDLPIVVYTAYPDEYSRETVRGWGADDYVVKGGDLLPLVTALFRHTKPRNEVHP